MPMQSRPGCESDPPAAPPSARRRAGSRARRPAARAAPPSSAPGPHRPRAADFSPSRVRPTFVRFSRSANCSSCSSYRSARSFTRPRSTTSSTSHSPMPSMSMAVRRAKCRIDSFRRARQLTLTHRATASPSSRTTADPHDGQLDGIENGRRWRAGSIIRTTLGITSPARSISTRSPICNPRRAISSSLCSVARDTVTPPTCTGRSRARGVTAPVRPHLHVDALDDRLRLLRGRLAGERPTAGTSRSRRAAAAARRHPP